MIAPTPQQVRELIARANTHLDADESANLSHANGIELLRALEATVGVNEALVENLQIVTDTLAYLKGENWETIKSARAALALAKGGAQ